MAVIRAKDVELENAIDASSVLGAKVVSKGGSVLGTVSALWIHPSELRIEGISVAKGFFREGDYVGRNYLESVNRDGAMLKINPVTEFVGHEVFDPDGKRVGKVKSVERANDSNNIVSIVVSRGGL